MTITFFGIASGEERDDDAACNTALAASTVTCETTYTEGPGTRCLKIPWNTATSRACFRVSNISTVGADVGSVYQGFLKLSGAITTTAGLVGDGVSGSTQRYIRVNTAGKLEVYDKAGTLFATSASAFSSSAGTEWMVMIDAATTPSNLKIAIWMNRQIEAVVNTGLSRASFYDTSKQTFWGEYNSASAKGADGYLTHAAYAQFTTAAESPLLKSWPSLYIVGGGSLPGTAEYLASEWDVPPSSTTGTPNTFQDVDDLGSPGAHPGHDSGTTVQQANAIYNKRLLMTYSASNPVASTDTVWDVFHASTGSLVSAGKIGYFPMLRMSGSDSSNPTINQTTGYAGVNGRYINGAGTSRPGGGSWTYADFDPGDFGFGGRTPTSAEASGLGVGGKMTDLAGPLILLQPQGKWYQTLDGESIDL